MACSGLEPRAASWKPHTNPLCYSGLLLKTIHSSCTFVKSKKFLSKKSLNCFSRLKLHMHYFFPVLLKFSQFLKRTKKSSSSAAVAASWLQQLSHKQQQHQWVLFTSVVVYFCWWSLTTCTYGIIIAFFLALFHPSYCPWYKAIFHCWDRTLDLIPLWLIDFRPMSTAPIDAEFLDVGLNRG